MYGCMDVWMYGCMDVWMDVRQMPLVPSSVASSVRQPTHQARQPASIASTAPEHRSKQQRAVVGRWMADLTWSGRWVTVCLCGCVCVSLSLSVCVSVCVHCASNVCRTPTLRHVWANTYHPSSATEKVDWRCQGRWQRLRQYQVIGLPARCDEPVGRCMCATKS